MYFDSHCHLNDPRCDAYLEQWLPEAQEAKISGFFLGGICPDEWKQQLLFRQKYSGFKILTSAGLHPWWVAKQDEIKIQSAIEILKNDLHQHDACGEIGLDSYAEQMSFQVQTYENCLKVASDQKKPVILHVVREHPQAIHSLQKVTVCGLVHSYSGNWSSAKKYLDRGLMISISGNFISQTRAALEEVIQKVPLESLLIETDCPDQHIDREKRLQAPNALLRIAEDVATLRKTTAHELLVQSKANLMRLVSTY